MEMSKSDKVVLFIVGIGLLIVIWVVLPIVGEDIAIWKKALLSLAILIYLYTVATKKTLAPPKTKSKIVRAYNVYAGWDRKLISIGLKIVAIVCIIVGVYVIIQQGSYWGLGFVTVALGPMIWYLSTQAKARSKEFFEANK